MIFIIFYLGAKNYWFSEIRLIKKCYDNFDWNVSAIEKINGLRSWLNTNETFEKRYLIIINFSFQNKIFNHLVKNKYYFFSSSKFYLIKLGQDSNSFISEEVRNAL